MKTKHIYLFVLLILTGCISDFEANLPYKDEDILVIEGDIVSNTECDIILSKTFALEDDRQPENTIRAKIVLVGDDGYRSEEAYYAGRGIHRLAVGNLKADVAYSLEIICEGQTYTSTPEKPLHTPEIDNISWKQADKDGTVSIRVSTSQDESEVSYYMWDYVEDWEYASRFLVVNFYDPKKREMITYDEDPYYFCWRTKKGKEILIGTTEALRENRIANQELYTRECSDERFSLLYSIRVKQYALTKKAYEYFQNRARLSNDMGGLFTPQPSELKGNVTCTTDKSKKVIGYINTMLNTTSKQLFISPDEIRGATYVQSCLILTSFEALTMMKDEDIKNYHDFYLRGFWPLDGETLDETTQWTKPNCIDCRLRGGTKNKPDFWPNNHQ